MKTKIKTRQAVSIARKRREWNKLKLCVNCGHRPRAEKFIVSTGRWRVLTRCAECAAARKKLNANNH